MPKPLVTDPALRRTADHYALRAHLVLDAARNESMTVNHAGELGCYLETAWQGAARSFKSPPNKLLQAKLVMVDMLSKNEAREFCIPDLVTSAVFCGRKLLDECVRKGRLHRVSSSVFV